MNPNTTPRLNADLDALRNDVEQAHELAGEFQRQLAHKSNDVAQLQQLVEKTLRDLELLQAGIIALREERHRLANDVMLAACGLRADSAKDYTGNLRDELDAARTALGRSARELVQQLRERDATIANLTLENFRLQQQRGKGSLTSANRDAGNAGGRPVAGT